MVLAACGPVKGAPPESDAAGPDAEGVGFQLAVLTANVAVPLDGSATVEVAVTRTGGFAGEIEIAAVTPPTGLEVTGLTIPADEDIAEIVVGALAPLAIGDTIDFNLEATATGIDPQTAAITDAEVTGRPGSLDDSFGVGTGYASISFGADDGGSFDALDLLGGKIIATGIGAGGLGAQRFSTMRFTDTGAIDTTFNGGTLQRTSFDDSSNEDTRSAAIGHQIDGRFILIGSNHSTTGIGDVAMARIGANGGGGGVEFGNQADPAEALFNLGGEELVSDGVVLADGRIVAVGSSAGHHAVAIAQSSGGGLDGAFNTTGFVRDVLGNSSTASAVTVDANNRLVVVGSTNNGSDSDLTLHRYTNIGLDTTFGNGGRVIVAAPSTNETAIGVAVLSTGTILVAGTSGSSFQLRRFNPDGTPDPGFGTNGVVELPSAGAAARDLLVLPDGKILVLGQLGNSAVLVRFKSTGVIDPLFGANGLLTIAFGDSAEVNAFIVYDSHKIVIAGGNVGGVPGPGTKGLLARVWM